MKALKIFLSLTLSSCLLFASCVDADIDEAVDYDDFYTNADDADAAILGLYGKVMDLAGPIVVLNELRSDLLDVTGNATVDLQEINSHKPSKNNEWTDVTRFYSVIQTCNDMMYNFEKMKKENKLTTDEYNERYSDVGAIRCWVYFQLGVQFGKVVYITDPVVDVRDLKKYEGTESELSLDQLIPELITCMDNLPTKENYVNSKLISGTVDGYSLEPFFINKKCLLGDLYLFNNQYEKAVEVYREVLRVGEDDPATAWSQQRKNRIYCYVWNSGDVEYFQVLVSRQKPEDASLVYNAWKGMFSLPADNAGVKDEMIWEMSFDYRYAPEYPFVEIFSNVGKGKYYLKPSTYAVDELWGKQTQKNGTSFDARGLTGGVAQTMDGQYLVTKYSLGYDDINKPFEVNGKWFLYRAALLHLRYAEAANRAGHPRLAWALVNDGIRGAAFNWTPTDGRSAYRGDSIRLSSWGAGMPYPAPYDFDGRESNQPYLRSPYRNGGGIRGRANLPNISLADCVTKQDSMKRMEEIIINESALELAFEGHRWTDLIRIARRYDKEGNSISGSEFLRQTLEKKYQMSGATMPDLSSYDKWFLEFYR